jgi:hypothetical protein
LQFVQIGERE